MASNWSNPYLRFGPFAFAATILVAMIANAIAFSADSRSNPLTRMVSNNLDLYSPKSKRKLARCNPLSAAGVDAPVTSSKGAVGLYKKFADHAVEQLLGTEWLQIDDKVPTDLSEKQAPARGSKIESTVRITTKALIPSTKFDDGKPLVRYARITLLETVPVSCEVDDAVSVEGIQVLNFVVLPNADTTLPVLGIDLVSLPGKHLLLLDAQPMAVPNPHESHWEEWYSMHVANNTDNPEKDGDEPLKYAWGGDFPDPVKTYVSKYALWTRLQNIAVSSISDDNASDESVAATPATDAIQRDIFDAFQAHLGAYLELLARYAEDMKAVEGENHQSAYLDYRRNNDPAKPMLNALYGPEWTQTLLDNVLFPRE
ncbi:unnamed protein product [Pseudo-nitzschia multistriata]|uniref:Phycoerythrobilin:ferredoxin oxidoreductase n=1 Tax=Pseudo-nitzschia multistriata TaxID=183589 RepID=A0A448Z1X7_9STRA|nr:unnamed protein product [Pseudo-nitzschia multistriata]